MGKLLILDGHAVIHRAFHAVPPMASGGQQINALYGFYATLIASLEKIKPKYLAICMDPPGPVFRNEEYLAYRSQRKPAPPELRSQFPIIKESLQAAHLPLFSVGGYEADDAIGTITKKALKRISKKTKKKLVDEIYILTGDRDLMQLIDDKCSLLMPGRGMSDLQITKSEQSIERLGVTPDKVVDLKAITGDSSDNYPGVPGVGPVGAIKLLDEYHTLDNIYKNIDSLPEKIKQKFIDHKDDAYMSQRLAQLVFDVPLDFKLKDLKYSKKTRKNLIAMFQTYNFKSLTYRLEGKHRQDSGLKKIAPPKVDENQQSLF